LSDLLATKPLDLLLTEARDESGTGLRRVLGPVNLVTLGIGAIIGAGIFVLTGTVAANFTGHPCRRASYQHTRPAHLHRHAVGLCDRVCGRLGVADKASRPSSPLQSPARSPDPNPGHRNFPGPDGQPALEHLVPPDRLADCGHGDLLRLRPKPQPVALPLLIYLQFIWKGEIVNVSASMIAASKARGQRLAGSIGYSGACSTRKVITFIMMSSPAHTRHPTYLWPR
jgi:hypothetical protein